MLPAARHAHQHAAAPHSDSVDAPRLGVQPSGGTWNRTSSGAADVSSGST
jgi:hypothetical protein